jgi:hypothetical protein
MRNSASAPSGGYTVLMAALPTSPSGTVYSLSILLLPPRCLYSSMGDSPIELSASFQPYTDIL